MISVNNLTKAYNDKNVIENISFNLESGKIYGLIGANGAGKSTIINCVTGVFKPDEGEILMDKSAVYDNSVAKEKIGLIPDEPIFVSSYSVKRFVKYYKSFYTNFSDEVFDKYCDVFSIDTKKSADNLSLGQKKRLQIALVMARDTDVIVMDEPENGLDNDARNDFRNIIRNVADEGKSILISSHDLGNIENMCDEIIFIDNGRILYKGIIDDVLSKVDKWTVKADETKLKDFVVSEITGNTLKVLAFGDRKSNEEKLLEAGAEIIDNEKVTLADVYMLLRKGGGR